MYIMNGIAYAGEPKPTLKVSGVRPLPDKRLWVRFNTGEAKIFDFSPLLHTPAFAPLENESVFRSVYIDYGIPMWNDGEIDIAPEKLYADGAVSFDDLQAIDAARAEYANGETVSHNAINWD